MQSVQPKYRIGMTVAACLWLGLFPLLQGGTYAHITYDKWVIMLILTGVTLLCFCIDLIVRFIFRKRVRNGRDGSSRSFIPLILAGALLCWTVLSCLFSEHGALKLADFVREDTFDKSISRVFRNDSRTVRFRLREHHLGLYVQQLCCEHEKLR